MKTKTHDRILNPVGYSNTVIRWSREQPTSRPPHHTHATTLPRPRKYTSPGTCMKNERNKERVIRSSLSFGFLEPRRQDRNKPFPLQIPSNVILPGNSCFSFMCPVPAIPTCLNIVFQWAPSVASPGCYQILGMIAHPPLFLTHGGGETQKREREIHSLIPINCSGI